MKNLLKWICVLFLVIFCVLIMSLLTGCKVNKTTEVFHHSSHTETYHDTTIYLKGDAVSTPADSAQMARIYNLLKTHKTDTVKIASYSGNVQMRYYLDQFGVLQASCEQKDKSIAALIKTIHDRDSSNQVIILPGEVKHEMPWWGWMSLGAMGMVTIYYSLLKRFLKT